MDERLILGDDDEETARELLFHCRSDFEVNEIRKNVGKRIEDIYVRSYFYQLSADCLRYIEVLGKAGIHANNIEQVSKWIKAEAERRLVVLPVPVNTEIFYITNSHRAAINNKNRLARVIKSRKVDSVTIGKGGYMRMNYGTTLSSSANEIGKTVFLTREEAEAALEGDKA